MKRRMLSLFMVLCMVATMLPTVVLASEGMSDNNTAYHEDGATEERKGNKVAVVSEESSGEYTQENETGTTDTGVERTNPQTNELNCHEMTNLWFGNTQMATLSSVDDNSSLENAVTTYFSVRENDYTGNSATLFSSDNVSVSEDILETLPERTENIEEMQNRLNIRITDAEVTTNIDRENIVYNDDGTVTLYVYEWTFYDYDDLNDGVGGSDVSGYGTNHRITLRQENSEYVILSDEYDESDLLGICTIQEENRAELFAFTTSNDDADTTHEDEDAEAVLMSEIFTSYNPSEAASYANQYATNYNSAYRNFNSVGGDCANYASQCIRAGGMPMVTGSSGWYYSSSSNYSTSWVNARGLTSWMANNRGTRLTATASNVWQGSPMFYNNSSGHSAICVGKNSAGTPIVNAHNNDRYQVNWNYYSGVSIETVQLTSYDPLEYRPPLSFEYFTCDVEIVTPNRTVNLYPSAGSTSRTTYFSRSVTAYSTRGARGSDGSTWYEIGVNHKGSDTTMWIKAESDFTVRNSQPQQFYLDLNGYLDGSTAPSIAGYGTVDVWINNNRVADDVSDYYTAHNAGSTYRIDDIKTSSGKTYNGVRSGSTSGTLNGNTEVILSYSSAAPTIQYFNCNVEIVTPNRTVDLYKNLTDSSRTTYFSRSVTASSTRGARMSDGSTWYEIGVNHQGSDTTMWIKADSDFTIRDNSAYSMSFSTSSLSLKVGETKTVSVEFSDKPDVRNFRCDSANEGIARVSISGSVNWADSDYGTGHATLSVTGVAVGTTTVSASLRDSNGNSLHSRSINVTVSPNPATVTVSKNKISLVIGEHESETIQVTCSGNRDNTTLSVVESFRVGASTGTMRDGTFPLTLNAKSPGDATITIGLKDSTTNEWVAKASVEVTVSAKQYTVSYNANGGRNAPSSQIKSHNQSLTLTGDKPVRDDYNFEGWATTANGTVQYQPGATYSENNALSLFAVWRRVPDSLKLGDINGDGKINQDDADWISNAFLELVTLTSAQRKAADTNGDGEINALDLQLILNYMNGRIDKFPAESNDTGTLQVTVGNRTSQRGATVDIPVSILNNSGISGATLVVSYNQSVLTLDSIIKGPVFDSGSFNAYTSSGIIQWYHTANVTNDGILFTLRFKVGASAQPNEYNIGIGLRDNISANLSDINSRAVSAQFVGGTLTIQNSGVMGDITGDNVVAINDVVKLARAVAGTINLTEQERSLGDVTGDNVIAINDVVKLARYVAGNIASLQGVSASLMAEGDTASIEVASIQAGKGETVQVPVTINTNPGIAGAQLDILFDDSALTLKGITRGLVLSDGTFSPDVANKRVQWYYDQADITATGVLFTLEFEVSNEANDGEYFVEVRVKDGIDANLSNFNFDSVRANFQSGKVIVGNPVPDTFAVSVTGGSADKAEYAEGETVTIMATVPENKDFDRWSSNDGVSFADETAVSTTFVMPGKAVSILANFKDKPDPVPDTFAVIVTGGSADKAEYAEGETVTIMATVPENKDFDRWSSNDGVSFADETAVSTTFVMPGKAVSVLANFKDKPNPVPDTFAVSVTGGSADKAEYAEGETVTIMATVPENKDFDEWSSNDGVSFADETAVSTTFVMPGKAVSILANFKDKPNPVPDTFAVSVTGGSADKTEYAEGETVTIMATVPENKDFDRWSSNDGVSFADETAVSTTFVMPGKAVSILANFKDKPDPVNIVTVNGGEGSGSYKAGETVRISAPAEKNGQPFTKWTWTGPDDFTIPDATSTTVSFVMPTGSVTVNANYGGCYVATAVYGSYDCPEVWTLRRFRDKVLAKTWYGRLFIHFYYAVSPTAVRFFGQTQWFQNFFRDMLDPWVADLQANGFESTPYQDQTW